MDRRALVDKLKPSEGTLRQRGITALYVLDSSGTIVIDTDPVRRVDIVAVEDMLSARTGEILRVSRRDELRTGTSLIDATRVF